MADLSSLEGQQQPSLTDFLLARISDEEDLVQSAEGAPDRSGWQLWTVLKGTANGAATGPRGSIEMSPSRALAECASKRAILDEAAEIASWTFEWDDETLHYRDMAHALLIALAAPYSSHPDFDPSWLGEGNQQ